jgi:hypothetical protein
METKALILAVIIIVLLIMVWRGTTTTQLLHDGIMGMWLADENFCAKSEIDGMMIYIGPNESGVHNAHLLLYSNNAIIAQCDLTINVRPHIYTNFNNISRMTATATLASSDYDNNSDAIDLETIMPLQQTLVYEPATGHMTWTGLDRDGKETLYADFYRDNIASSQQ